LKYSEANQPKRYAEAIKDQNQRVLDIDQYYQPNFLNGQTVLVTGGNRGLGQALVAELIEQKAKVVVTVRDAIEIPGAELVISGVDVTQDDCGMKVAKALQHAGLTLDIMINNAGYFYGPLETIESLNFSEQLKMIDICALGPLRMSSSLFNLGLIQSDGKIAMITSQGGSIAWRKEQNPSGHDYGHHMSKAAANMMGVLLAQELKGANISVAMLHPGFNKTDMTRKYEKIWQEEGAVDASVGAKRVLHEIGQMTLDTSGAFINCEDGLHIPW